MSLNSITSCACVIPASVLAGDLEHTLEQHRAKHEFLETLVSVQLSPLVSLAAPDIGSVVNIGCWGIMHFSVSTLGPQLLKKWLGQMVEALYCAHQKQVIHR